MPKRSDEDRLIDILYRCHRAAAHCDRADERNREMAMSAIERELEIIGEASGSLSETVTTGDTFDWRLPKGQRNWLIHAYFDVQWSRLAEVVRDRLPELVVATNAALDRLEVSEKRRRKGLEQRVSQAKRDAELLHVGRVPRAAAQPRELCNKPTVGGRRCRNPAGSCPHHESRR